MKKEKAKKLKLEDFKYIFKVPEKVNCPTCGKIVSPAINYEKLVYYCRKCKSKLNLSDRGTT